MQGQIHKLLKTQSIGKYFLRSDLFPFEKIHTNNFLFGRIVDWEIGKLKTEGILKTLRLILKQVWIFHSNKLFLAICTNTEENNERKNKTFYRNKGILIITTEVPYFNENCNCSIIFHKSWRWLSNHLILSK